MPKRQKNDDTLYIEIDNHYQYNHDSYFMGSHMNEKIVFLCQRQSQYFFCMADSYLLIPWSKKAFESFRDDRFFFGRWHSVLGKINAQNFAFEWIVAYRIGVDLTITNANAWLALSQLNDNSHLKAG